MDEQDAGVTDDSPGRRELIAVIVLSITAVLTAWSGFQASKWGGEMSIAFSEASSSRIEAARQQGTANQRTAVLVGLWTQWVDARGTENDELADFLQDRFPEPLATAQEDWLATDPLTSSVSTSPFDMPSYVLPEREAAADADARADQRFADALVNNQRGDNYTLLTVLFAAVLFFAAMSQRMNDARSQRLLLSLAIVLGLIGVGFGLSFPIEI
jgi:hypothetical protein